jgi:hypothetical protein
MAERRSAAGTEARAPANAGGKAADDERAKATANTGAKANTDGKAAGNRPRLSAAEAAREGLQQIVELTGKEPESVTGVRPEEDGWRVSVDVVEDRRIPPSTDILATYEAELDGDGELLSYRRLRRYSRGRGDDKDC